MQEEPTRACPPARRRRLAPELAGSGARSPSAVAPAELQPGLADEGIAAGADLKVIDLFCGAGGLSEGFRQAGFDIRLGVDTDGDACSTYQLNQPGAVAVEGDLGDLSSVDLLDEARLNEVQIVLGGPSCQGFSTHGRRNGWVRPDDSRNFLYGEYARIIEELRPLCFVMENVPGLRYYDDGRFWERKRRSLCACRRDSSRLRACRRWLRVKAHRRPLPSRYATPARLQRPPVRLSTYPAQAGQIVPAGVEPAKSGRNPALSRNCEAPAGDEPGRLHYADGRQLSTEGRFVRQRRRASSADARRWA